MYQAINDYVIAKKLLESTTTASGIITTSVSMPRYQVFMTNEKTKDLQDKVIITEKARGLDNEYVSIDYKDIIAVVA